MMFLKTGSLHGLSWLLQLRWAAGAAALMCHILASTAFGYELPDAVLLGCVTLLWVSNALLVYFRKQLQRLEALWMAVILFADILLLTFMLFITGGAHNPFTIVYLLPIIAAVILLKPPFAWAALISCSIGFGVLFVSPGHESADVSCGDSFKAHLAGMLEAQVLTGAGIVAFVSRLKSAWLRQNQAMDELLRASEQQARFVSLATLAAGVAHELATPLSTIAVVARELDLPENSPSETLKADARLLRQEVLRCQKIIDCLRTPSDASSEALVEMRLDEFAQAVSSSLPAPLSSEVRFEATPPERRLRLPFARIASALSILLRNAADATSESACRAISCHLQVSNNLLECSVIDNGQGIKAENLPRLGEPFFTTKGHSGGMGLGLFLVRRFAESCKGSVDFSSLPGQGTRVRLLIPLYF